MDRRAVQVALQNSDGVRLVRRLQVRRTPSTDLQISSSLIVSFEPTEEHLNASNALQSKTLKLNAALRTCSTEWSNLMFMMNFEVY